jgi:uncharacterized membrane protein YjjB (DUF3815 family)
MRGLSKADVTADTTCSPVGLNQWLYIPFLIVTSISFNMLLNAHLKQMFPMILSASIAFTASYTLSPLGNNASSVLAAFLSSAAANLYSRLVK